jgi:hypothetical protein
MKQFVVSIDIEDKFEQMLIDKIKEYCTDWFNTTPEVTKEPAPHVLVIVKGGLVTGAWASSEKVGFDIIDFDNEPGDNWEDEDKRINEESKGMIAIY